MNHLNLWVALQKVAPQLVKDSGLDRVLLCGARPDYLLLGAFEYDPLVIVHSKLDFGELDAVQLATNAIEQPRDVLDAAVGDWRTLGLPLLWLLQHRRAVV